MYIFYLQNFISLFLWPPFSLFPLIFQTFPSYFPEFRLFSFLFNMNICTIPNNKKMYRNVSPSSPKNTLLKDAVFQWNSRYQKAVTLKSYLEKIKHRMAVKQSSAVPYDHQLAPLVAILSSSSSSLGLLACSHAWMGILHSSLPCHATLD